MQALAEQVDLYTEAVTAKDHVVVELTNQVTSRFSVLGVGLLTMMDLYGYWATPGESDKITYNVHAVFAESAPLIHTFFH